MLRITGGRFRGRQIAVPSAKGDGRETRPSKAMLRQALFNSLQTQVPEARVLDLFAGSGSMGIEALSRGASHVVFVDDSRVATKTLAANIKLLGIESESQIVARGIATSWDEISRLGPFDIILADPPYADGWELKLLSEAPWQQWLAPDGIFALEWGVVKSRFENLPEESGILVKGREKLYGDSGLTFYRRKSE